MSFMFVFLLGAPSMTNDNIIDQNQASEADPARPDDAPAPAKPPVEAPQKGTADPASQQPKS
jgi:hypothetical protein